MAKFFFAETTDVVEGFEGHAKGVHLFMATPASFFVDDRKAFAEGLVFVVGNLGVDIDGDVHDRPGEEFFPDPFAAADGVVLKIATVCDEPGRLGQDAKTLAFRSYEGHLCPGFVGSFKWVEVVALGIVGFSIFVRLPLRLTWSGVLVPFQ